MINKILRGSFAFAQDKAQNDKRDCFVILFLAMTSFDRLWMNGLGDPSTSSGCFVPTLGSSFDGLRMKGLGV
jgi:hypothetical protein